MTEKRVAPSETNSMNRKSMGKDIIALWIVQKNDSDQCFNSKYGDKIKIE